MRSQGAIQNTRCRAILDRGGHLAELTEAPQPSFPR
jgi:hypothetical protein